MMSMCQPSQSHTIKSWTQFSAHRISRGDTMFDWPLTPPKQVTLLISLILAIFACLVHWLHIAVPPLHSGFVILVLGYLVLLAGNVFRDV